MKSYFLHVRLENSEEWQETEIFESLIIGRSEECDFVLADRLASRKHAQISIRDDLVYLVDLNSSNGTKILGQKITPNIPKQISEGDYFSIGHSLCQVVSSQENQPYRLWYRVEDQPWYEITFSEDIIIGRGEDAGLIVQEGHISRHHALLKVSGGNFYLQDLGSQNGTYLEDQRLPANQPVSIFPGQYFKIGRALLTVADVEKQIAFHQTVADLSSEVNLPVVKSKNKPLVQPQAKPRKKTLWPWLLGVGSLLTACVCVVVFGGLYLLDQAAGAALDQVDEIAGLVEDNQDVITGFVEEGIDSIEDADELLNDNGSELVPEVDDLVDAGTGLVDELMSDTSDQNTSSSGRKWLVMMYQNADDESLEYDIVFDVNSAESIGSTDEVAIVVQLDRFDGSYSGDGDWTGSRRYYLTPDGDLEAIRSETLSDLGEVDSGDVNTLVDFTIWAMQNYPADNYILVMSDHGAGWFGGYTDGDNGNEDGIYLPALESALEYITSQTGVEQLDILGFDACLMAELEVWATVAPYASIGVASEETESATGWAYGAYLDRLVKNPTMSAEELSKAIVETFVEDDLAYAYYGENPASVMRDSTLSAIRLSGIPSIMAALDGLAGTLENVDQSKVAEARTYSRSYLAFDDYEPFFLDLVHFAQMVCASTNDSLVCSTATTVEQAVNAAIITEKHGSGMDGSNGVTFYFPDSDFFEVTKDNSYGYAYRAHAVRFTNHSIWDEFLDYHYQITERMP